MDFPNSATLISLVIVLLIAFTIHELAHAIIADRLGDPTPRRMGRITLNPIAHLDPLGTIMIIVTQRFGWAKPVMVNPLNLEGNPRTSMAIVAAAGPLSNLALAVIFSIPVRFGFVTLDNPSGFFPSLGYLFNVFLNINLILLFFNLIPVPPLDGYKILTGILPLDLAYKMQALEQYGFLILLAAIFFLPMLGLNFLDWIVTIPSNQVLRFLLGL